MKSLFIEFCWHFTNRKFSTSPLSLCKKPATIQSFWVRTNAKTIQLRLKVNVSQWLGARRQQTVQFILQLLRTLCATFAFKMSIIYKTCWKKSQNWILSLLNTSEFVALFLPWKELWRKCALTITKARKSFFAPFFSSIEFKTSKTRRIITSLN